MLLPYGSQDGLRGSSLKTCFQSGTRLQSYPHIGPQRKGCQIFAEGAKRFLVCVRRVEVWTAFWFIRNWEAAHGRHSDGCRISNQLFAATQSAVATPRYDGRPNM